MARKRIKVIISLLILFHFFGPDCTLVDIWTYRLCHNVPKRPWIEQRRVFSIQANLSLGIAAWNLTCPHLFPHLGPRPSAWLFPSFGPSKHQPLMPSQFLAAKYITKVIYQWIQTIHKLELWNTTVLPTLKFFVQKFLILAKIAKITKMANFDFRFFSVKPKLITLWWLMMYVL